MSLDFSIPERAWSWLELGSFRPRLEKGDFQSLRGLGVGWNTTCPGTTQEKRYFQSLRGLGVGWNGGRCCLASEDVPFSIPERAWSWLELQSWAHRGEVTGVFNP